MLEVILIFTHEVTELHTAVAKGLLGQVTCFKCHRANASCKISVHFSIPQLPSTSLPKVGRALFPSSV